MRPTPLLLAILIAACGSNNGTSAGNNGDDNSGNNGQDGTNGPGQSTDDADGGARNVPQAYIRGDDATKLIFELDAVESVTARTQPQEYVSQQLATLLDKPDGIEWTADETIESRGADYVWTFDELKSLAASSNNLEIAANAVKIHVMYLDGRYEDENVLGVAWSNRHIAMFAEVLNNSCERPLLGDRVCVVAESSVLLHEVGHVIGLVDNGVDMVEDHKDADHGAHDNNEDCVMYWAYDGVSILDTIASRLTGGTNELQFDQACQDDIAAARDAE